MTTPTHQKVRLGKRKEQERDVMSQLVDDVHQPHKVLCSEGNSVADAEALPAGHFRIGRCNVSSLIPGHGGIGSVVKKPEQQAPFTTNSAVDKDTAVDKSRSLLAGQESMTRRR